MGAGEKVAVIDVGDVGDVTEVAGNVVELDVCTVNTGKKSKMYKIHFVLCV